MIKRVLAAILVAGSVWGFPVTTNEVAVDVDDSRTFSFRIAQGETQYFKLTYEKSGVELSVAGLTADFLYQAQGWTNWGLIAGTAASNYVVFPWGPDYDNGDSRYKGWVRLRDSNGNPAYRTGMDFAMIRTPGFQPNPVAMNTNSVLDWATYHGYEHTATAGPVRPDFVTIGAVTNADGSLTISGVPETDPVYSSNTYAVAMDQDVSSTGAVAFASVSTPVVKATSIAGISLQAANGTPALLVGPGNSAAVSTLDGLSVAGALLVQGTNVMTELAGKVAKTETNDWTVSSHASFVLTNDTRTVSLGGNLSALNLTASGAITGATATVTGTATANAFGTTGLAPASGQIYATSIRTTGRAAVGADISSVAQMYLTSAYTYAMILNHATQPLFSFHTNGTLVSTIGGTAGGMTFYRGVGNTTSMVLGADGNFGIGPDTTPDYKMDVQGTLGVDGLATLSSNLTVSGSVTAGSYSSTGDVSAQNLTASGAITGATANISGNLVVDTSTLFVDAANNRVGIGTASPSHDLSAIGASAKTIMVQTTGTSAGGAYMQSGTSGAEARFLLINSTTNGRRWDIQSRDNGSLEFLLGGSDVAISVTSNRFVGIATTTPTARLHVNGSAIITTNLTVSGSITAGSYSAGANAGISRTNTWVDLNSVTNTQIFISGILTSWTQAGP